MRQILEWNEDVSSKVRSILQEKNIYMVNVMGSPGAGKTTFIVNLIKYLRDKGISSGVIEGDIEGTIDAERIQKEGFPVVQLNTEGACHIEAKSIENILPYFDLDKLNMIFVENIGNLVCPAEFDIGENLRIALLSIPEGDDKVVKYPLMFIKANAVVLNKYDMAKYFNFNDGKVEDQLGERNKEAEVFKVDSTDESEIQPFAEWLIKKYKGSDWTTKPEDIDFETETIRSLLKICDFKSSYDVSYPYVVDKLGQKYAGTDDNSLAAHKWFTENTSSKLGGRNRNVQILPKILSFTQELKPYQADIYVKKEPEKYVIGNVYLGVVIGYNVKKTSAQIKLNNGGKVSLFFKNVPKAEYGEIDKVLPKNKRVEVVYCGNIDGRDNWKMR